MREVNDGSSLRDLVIILSTWGPKVCKTGLCQSCNDIVVATDDVARGDFVVPNLAEDTGGESRKTIGTGVVSRVGEAKDVEPTDPELSGAMFAIAEAGGFEGSDRGEIVGSVAGIHREVRVLDGAGTVITIQRWGRVTSGDGVTARSTCS